MKWPATWKEPSMIDLLKGTPINFLFVEKNGDLDPVVARAQAAGIKVSSNALPASDVLVLEGEWPGVKLSQTGAIDLSAAGPTGDPWVDSNGWKIRLNAEIHPNAEIWVNAVPKALCPRESYLIGVAEAAVHRGRWIIQLDDVLAAEIADRKTEALETWESLTAAAAFFAEHVSWSDYLPEAVMGIISDFAGQNEFMSHEILNLVARTNQQYRILLKARMTESSLRGLKAVLYPDVDPPPAESRTRILEFVKAGGMLIAGPGWGQVPGNPEIAEDRPRYAMFHFGKGKIALSRSGFDDPYVVANDSVVLISHRYDLLRFYNGGAVGSLYTKRPDGKRAVVQMLLYASMRGGNPLSVRVVGKYKTGRLFTLAQHDPRAIDVEIRDSGLELHLPPVSQYAAVELEA
jgi:hypothetical protein